MFIDASRSHLIRNQSKLSTIIADELINMILKTKIKLNSLSPAFFRKRDRGKVVV